MPDLIGQNIGRYHIIDQLGQGGMSTVYWAYNKRLEGEAKFLKKNCILNGLLVNFGFNCFFDAFVK
jgi:hypothetical protein